MLKNFKTIPLFKKIFLISICGYLSLLLAICVFLPFPVLAGIETSAPQWKNPLDSMQISIPGLSELSSKYPIACQGEGDSRYCDVPWIGVYLAAIYKYAIGMVGIVAAIAMMIGGVRWLTAGGNTSSVGDAKEWIIGSLTGLFLALTSYLILYTVNPDLVKFKPIRVKEVKNVTLTNTNSRLTGCKYGRSSECNTDRGYYNMGDDTGKCSGEDPCKGYTDQTALSGCRDLHSCCCQEAPLPGCEWTHKSKCDDPKKESNYNKCGTNTDDSFLCCCSEAPARVGGGDIQAITNCINSSGIGGRLGNFEDPVALKNGGLSKCCTSDPFKKGTCAFGQHAWNSCHYGCNNGYQPQAVDWFWNNSNDICTLLDKCGLGDTLAKGTAGKWNIWGPANGMCGGRVNYEPGHSTHLHIPTSGCGH